MSDRDERADRTSAFSAFLMGAYIGAVFTVVAWSAYMRLNKIESRVGALEWARDEPKRSEVLKDHQARVREEQLRTHAELHRQMETAK